ncbi:uncharacterized protein LOC123536047 [Mercenaria mercenaria]|uniref:uncharacterized protein LOC123536047 n=1 Tax=Mercenaria mercenaria TaxID=6596 RepID=UPI00234E77DB|nr:uncharacterized protein LOC123536047 [Mercenaria mercenaria]
MPKLGKDDYNIVRAYRPITLESVIGKIFERVIANRLRWKCEAEEIFAGSQEAYRKNRSCINAVGRMVQNLQLEKADNKVSVVAVLDYESCFERVWRSGLLFKAREKGIKGRLWLYLYNYLCNRKFYITVNGEKSRDCVSKVGIPQGSVLSPFLCNIYTSDAMTNVTSKHTEFADDSSMWESGLDIKEVIQKLNKDIDTLVNIWCTRWNMGIAAEKTEVMIIKPNERYDIGDERVMLKNETIKVVRQKKVLGIIIDDELSFYVHVDNRTRSGFKALRSISHFGNDKRGCDQEIFMRLYKTLVLPVMDYGMPVVASATDYAEKEFGKVQRKALLTATGCMSSTATDQLEVMTGTLPISLHLKCKNAEELIRFYSKVEENPIKQDLQAWMTDRAKTNNCMYKLLISHFNEVKGKTELEHVETDFKYSKEGGLELCRKVSYIKNEEEHLNNKDQQVENIIEIISKLTDREISMFTDGSTLGNPGPTGAGACIYLKDKLAKEAASEMIGKQENENTRKVDKKELAKDLRSNVKQKWQRRYENTEEYETQRKKLETEVEEASNRHSEPVADINLKVLTGNVEGRREFGAEIQKLLMSSQNLFDSSDSDVETQPPSDSVVIISNEDGNHSEGGELTFASVRARYDYEDINVESNIQTPGSSAADTSDTVSRKPESSGSLDFGSFDNCKPPAKAY